MFRIKEYEKGWIVEYKTYKTFLFFASPKWVHVTHYAGMDDKPYYYKTPEEARDGALQEIKSEINFSFYFPNME